MRILCLTSRLPYPPDRGDRLRAYDFIRKLSQEHELTLLSFIAEESEREHLPSLQPFCTGLHVVQMSRLHSSISVLGNLWRPAPLQASYYRSTTMNRLVDNILSTRSFDAAYVHLFRMTPYLADRSDLYRIVDLTDAISQEIIRSLPYRGPVWRAIYALERPRIERFERWVARTFEETWLISDADRQVLSATCPNTNLRVIPNGVDQDRFFPTGQACTPDSLIFVGHMGVFHNVDAARHLVLDILPIVQSEIPGCTLSIVGAEPNARVRALGADPAVSVTGYVPNLNAHLNQAAVFVAPLRFAAGVQNKVLEAMAAARPVVTSSLVNAGLGAREGIEVLVADDAETTAKHIAKLLKDTSRRKEIGQAARQFVLEKYSWDQLLRRMNEIEAQLQA
jgi:sugar transferase (PEP-CTERM/EpsH1 system associated)